MSWRLSKKMHVISGLSLVLFHYYYYYYPFIWLKIAGIEDWKLGVSCNFSIFPSDWWFPVIGMVSRLLLAPLECGYHQLHLEMLRGHSPAKLQTTPLPESFPSSCMLWVTVASDYWPSSLTQPELETLSFHCTQWPQDKTINIHDIKEAPESLPQTRPLSSTSCLLPTTSARVKRFSVIFLFYFWLVLWKILFT